MMTVNVTPKSRTIANGTANDATPVEASFVELYNNDAALAAGINTVLGTDVTKGGIDGRFLVVRNGFTGVPADGEHAGLEVKRGTQANVQLRWNETGNCWEASQNGTGFFPLLPRYYKSGCIVRYAGPAGITVGVGAWADSTQTDLIEVASPLTVTLTAAGANGLDTGAEAANTWYFVYLIKKSSDGTVAALLSTVNEAASGSITLPGGFDLKRQLPVAVRNNAAGNFVRFRVGHGWPETPKIVLDDPINCRVQQSATASSFATYNASAFVPPISRVADFMVVNQGASAQSLFFREAGTSVSGSVISLSGAGFWGHLSNVTLNAGQQYESYATFGQLNDHHITAYTVTEVR